MKTQKMLQWIGASGLALALGVTIAATTATAHPYATCLTNSSGVVSFRLNEAADSVKVIWGSGSSSLTLGPVARGLTVTNVGATSPFRVEVKKTGTGAISRISDDANIANQFEYPRAVSVNKRPGSPFFGRVYVANARIGTTGTSRVCGDGIYVLNSDCTDAVGQGNTALTGGIDMATGTTSMPWRIRVGADDDMLYICDWSDAAGNLWQTDPNVSAASGINVFMLPVGIMDTPLDAGMNHGSLQEVIVTGSRAAGNLTVYTSDEDYETTPGAKTELNSLWRYDMGSAPFPWSSMPNQKLMTPSVGSGGNTMGLDRGSNGYFYLLDSRYSGYENVLQVIDPTGPAELYRSLTDSQNNLGLSYDYLSNCVSVAVSPDLKYCAVQRANAGEIILMPMVDGIPSLANRISFNAGTGTTGRQIEFDAAGNLYVVSNGAEWLRVFSLGLTTTAITGSDGTFSLETPPATVNVTADVNAVYEAGPATAVLTITRANTVLSQPLAVSFSTAGSAARGADYILQTNGVTFSGASVIVPAGSTSVNVTFVANEDTTSELTELATLTLEGNATYGVGGPSSQTLAIIDNDAAMADLQVVYGSMYERLQADYARLQVVRRGDTNAPSFTVNLTYSGTAAASRYSAPPTVTVDPGVVEQSFDITSPVNDLLLQGDQTIVAQVAAGEGYIVGTNSPTATATIVDDELPAETVLWSEDFNNADTSTNWTVSFASANGLDDFRAAFAYDYASGSAPVYGGSFPVLPNAPHSDADTLGLFLTVNKDEGSALGGAGINVYAKNQSFNGNYAVRFDMYLITGTGSYSTEHALFGINHSGAKTNWFRSGGVPDGWTFDGLFFGVEADAAGYDDYGLYTASTLSNPTKLGVVGAASQVGLFKSPPFAYSGAPANADDTSTPSWTDVEMSQVGDLVTLKINRATILVYTNDTTFTGGRVMLGYCDSFDSIGPVNSGVVIDNLRVVQLGSTSRPIITGIQVVGTEVRIAFTAEASDSASAFGVQASGTVSGTFGNVTAAINPGSSAGSFTAVCGLSGSQQFYRIVRK